MYFNNYFIETQNKYRTLYLESWSMKSCNPHFKQKDRTNQEETIYMIEMNHNNISS